MASLPTHRIAAGLLLTCAALASLSVPGHGRQSSPPPGALPPPANDLTRDDAKGSWLNFEVMPLDPLTLVGPDGAFLLAAHAPSGRIALLDAEALASVAEYPVGPGVDSLTPRPGTLEVWVTDRVQGTVSVLDLLEGGLRGSIRVGGEPHGFAFHPAGDRAYVACSAHEVVRVISTQTLDVVHEIPVPLESPRAVTFAFGRLWVAPFRSGNNTATVNTPDHLETSNLPSGKIPTVVDLADQAELPELPDRDLVAITPHPIDPTLDELDPELTRHGLGTLLFHVRARSSGEELWIPNTEAFNGLYEGQANFAGGRVAGNRITRVGLDGSQSVVDLDQLLPPTAPVAMPTDVAFDELRQRAYVVGYGTDVVAVLDTSGADLGWLGSYRVTPSEGSFAGARNLLLDPDGDRLFVYAKGDGSISVIDLGAEPSATVDLPAGTPIGYDPTPAAVKRGRGHFASAYHSGSFASSCNSCHPDGDFDGQVWDLSRFMDDLGTPADELQFELDRKGPLVSPVLRGLAETAPYHWRGEQETLSDFNELFVTLMKRASGPLPSEDFADLETYMKSLVHPANPRQELDRTLTASQAAGKDLFHDPAVMEMGGCVKCHALPLGTNNEVHRFINEGESGALSPVGQVTQLRGVGEKVAPVVQVGAPNDMPFLGLNELGIGFGNKGIIPSLPHFDSVFVDLTEQEHADLEAFLLAWDTGLAPASTFQFTARAGTPADASAASLEFLLGQSAAGNCDVVAFGRSLDLFGAYRPIALALEHGDGLFHLPSASLGPIEGPTLLAAAEAGFTDVTFLGLPLGTGRRAALDRDLDRLLDWDEHLSGSSPTEPDSDGDGLPDGHEVAWGTDPTVPDAESPDTVAPTFVSADGQHPAHVVLVTTNTVKFDLTTSEPCRVLVSSPQSSVAPVGSPVGDGYDVNHSLIVSHLPGGSLCDFQIVAEDPAGNAATLTWSRETEQILKDVTRVLSIDVDVSAEVSGDLELPVAEVTVLIGTRDGSAPERTYDVEVFCYFQPAGGPLQVVSQWARSPADDGVAAFEFELPAWDLATGSPPDRLVHVGVRELHPVGGFGYDYAESLDEVSFVTVSFRGPVVPRACRSEGLSFRGPRPGAFLRAPSRSAALEPGQPVLPRPHVLQVAAAVAALVDAVVADRAPEGPELLAVPDLLHRLLAAVSRAQVVAGRVATVGGELDARPRALAHVLGGVEPPVLGVVPDELVDRQAGGREPDLDPHVLLLLEAGDELLAQELRVDALGPRLGHVQAVLDRIGDQGRRVPDQVVLGHEVDQVHAQVLGELHELDHAVDGFLGHHHLQVELGELLPLLVPHPNHVADALDRAAVGALAPDDLVVTLLVALEADPDQHQAVLPDVLRPEVGVQLGDVLLDQGAVGDDVGPVGAARVPQHVGEVAPDERLAAREGDQAAARELVDRLQDLLGLELLDRTDRLDLALDDVEVLAEVAAQVAAVGDLQEHVDRLEGPTAAEDLPGHRALELHHLREGGAEIDHRRSITEQGTGRESAPRGRVRRPGFEKTACRGPPGAFGGAPSA